MGYTRPVDKLAFTVAFTLTGATSGEVEIDTGLKAHRFELWGVRTVVDSFATSTKIDTRIGVATGFAKDDISQRYASTENTLATPLSYANGPSTLRQEIQSDADGKIWLRMDLDVAGDAAGSVRVVLAPGG